MRPLALAMTLALCVLTSGCTDDAAPAAAPKKTTQADPNTFEAKAEKALLSSDTGEVSNDRQILRDIRLGDQRGKQWPTCEKVSRGYGRVSMSKTLVGVQDALMAAQVDDFVLCDKPIIYSSTRAAAEKAIERLAPDLPARQMVDYLIQKAPGPRMDDCWLKALRTSRQDGSAYTEAMQRAEARCKPIAR